MADTQSPQTYKSAADCPLGEMHGFASTHGNAAGADLCDWCGFEADASTAREPTQDALRERDPAMACLASLRAAISLLERGGKKAAASDRMFEQMLKDYHKAADNFAAALTTAASQPKAMADQSTEARLREALKPFVDCCEYIDENESDEEWAKFRLLIKDYRRAQEAFSLPDTSDELTRLRAEVEAMREERSRCIQFAGGQSPLICGSGSARTAINGGQANG